jgi:hypothetical protein
MSDLIISKKDEVYLKVTCEKSIARELSEFFTFFVPLIALVSSWPVIC